MSNLMSRIKNLPAKFPHAFLSVYAFLEPYVGTFYYQRAFATRYFFLLYARCQPRSLHFHPFLKVTIAFTPRIFFSLPTTPKSPHSNEIRTLCEENRHLLSTQAKTYYTY